MGCFNREGKKAQQERQKAEREAQQAYLEKLGLDRENREKIAYLKDQAWLASNGPQLKMPTFEVPGFGTLWEEADD